MLTAADAHHWGSIPSVVDYVARQIPSGATVLELGPGHTPFPRATTLVDFADLPPRPGVQTIKCDVAREPLPFPDKHFDFVYCRHMLEDMWNPFHVCAEISRVGRAGYVETPSPVAEICRGADGGAPAYRGYHHHRWVIWVRHGKLRFVSKYPLVEYLPFDERRLVGLLQFDRHNWNSYYLWTDQVAVEHLQSPLNFDIPRDYNRVLNAAIDESLQSTGLFLLPL